LIIVFGLVGVIVFDEKTIFASLTAGGIADFLAFFIFKPMDGIQKSRSSLAQVIVGFLTWYNDIRNWSNVTALEINGHSDIDKLEKISNISVNNSILVITALKSLTDGKKLDQLESIKNMINEQAAGNSHLKNSHNQP